MNNKNKMSIIPMLIISMVSIGGGIVNPAEAAQKIDLSKRIQVLEDRTAIKDLVDNFSVLADQKKTQEQTLLFTEDAIVDSYVDGKLVSSLKGRAQIGQTFGAYLGNFDTVYHINGQQTLELKGDTAEGTSYCAVTLIGMENGKRMKTASGVLYKDKYVRQNGKWLIASRVATFVFQDKQEAR